MLERPRAGRLRSEGKESGQDLYQADTSGNERPRCHPSIELEETDGARREDISCCGVNALTHISQATSGDFPTVLFEVVSKRSSVIESSLSIDDLNDILDDLSKNMGKQYVTPPH